MIMTETEDKIVIHKCHNCGSTNIVRNGRNRLGQEQYHCLDCNAYRVLRPKRKEATKNSKLRDKALKACLERCSLRGVCRIFNIGRQTLRNWILDHTDNLPDLITTLLSPKHDDVLGLDEMWSFVARKTNKTWIWTAICRRTRQIVAYAIGDHSEATCQKLWNAIPAEYRSKFCFSDLWRAYQVVIPAEQHQAVGKGSGETNHMERWYNTVRQWIGRFTRKTLSFSKDASWHERILRWFIINHNLRMQASLT